MRERFPGIRRAFRLGVATRELDEELTFHFQETREELLAKGYPAEEAEREARRRFGDLRHYRRELERIDGWAAARRRAAELGEAVFASARHALRRIRRATRVDPNVALRAE